MKLKKIVLITSGSAAIISLILSVLIMILWTDRLSSLISLCCAIINLQIAATMVILMFGVKGEA